MRVHEILHVWVGHQLDHSLLEGRVLDVCLGDLVICLTMVVGEHQLYAFSLGQSVLCMLSDVGVWVIACDSIPIVLHAAVVANYHVLRVSLGRNPLPDDIQSH